MTNEQAFRIQRELMPGSGCVPNGKPYEMYGIWVFPFTHAGRELHVYIIDRAITHESEHKKAMEEAAYQLREGVRDFDAS